MRLIFLDIDGVLNAHEKLASGYCGIQRPQSEHFIYWSSRGARAFHSDAARRR